MSQRGTDKSQLAEDHTKEARAFVRRVKTITRRKYTAEKKIRIVLEGFRRTGAQSSKGPLPNGLPPTANDIASPGLTRRTSKPSSRASTALCARNASAGTAIPLRTFPNVSNWWSNSSFSIITTAHTWPWVFNPLSG